MEKEEIGRYCVFLYWCHGLHYTDTVTMLSLPTKSCLNGLWAASLSVVIDVDSFHCVGRGRLAQVVTVY